MIVYLLTIIFFIYAAYICDFKGMSKYKLNFYCIEWIILVLIISLQWRLGVDNEGYEEYYKDIPTLSDLSISDFVIGSQHQQPLWMLYCGTIKMFSPSFVLFHIIHSITITSLIFIFLKKYTRFYLTAALFFLLSMYFFYFNLDIQRESLAIAIFLVSIPYLEKKRFLVYYLLSIVAFLFHVSALFLFGIPLFVWLFRYAVTFNMVLCGSILLSLVLIYSINYLFEFFLPNGETAELIFNRANKYYGADKNLLHLVLSGTLSLIPILGILYIRMKFQFKFDVLSLLMVLYLVVTICSVYISGIYRLKNYLILPYIVCLVSTLRMSFGDNKYKFLSLLSLILFIFLIGWEYARPLDGDASNGAKIFYYIPYKTIFD